MAGDRDRIPPLPCHSKNSFGFLTFALFHRYEYHNLETDDEEAGFILFRRSNGTLYSSPPWLPFLDYST
jgi:hypothetical protein